MFHCCDTLKSQIDPKAIWGYFWWKFSKLAKSKKEKKMVDLGVETKENPDIIQYYAGVEY